MMEFKTVTSLSGRADEKVHSSSVDGPLLGTLDSDERSETVEDLFVDTLLDARDPSCRACWY